MDKFSELDKFLGIEEEKRYIETPNKFSAIDKFLENLEEPEQKGEERGFGGDLLHGLYQDADQTVVLLVLLGIGLLCYKIFFTIRGKSTGKSVNENLSFRLPSRKVINYVGIFTAAVTVYDVVLFSYLIANNVSPSESLGVLDQVFLVSPLCGVIWLVGASIGRRRTRSYYLRHRYAQVLAIVLYFAALQYTTANPFFVTLNTSGSESYGLALVLFFVGLLITFVIWTVLVSIFAVPILIWKSQRLETSSTIEQTDTDLESSIKTDAVNHSPNTSERLKTLKVLWEDELISKEEYEKKKLEILEQI